MNLQNCPICKYSFNIIYLDIKNILLNSKCCFKNNNHYVYIFYNDVQKISSIEIKYNNIIYFWHLSSCNPSLQCKEFHAPKQWSSIPYFEPDFSDFNKLINKINLYLTFS